MEAARILITRFILIDKSLDIEREISLQGKWSCKLLFNTLQFTRCKTTLGNDYTFAAVPREPSTLIWDGTSLLPRLSQLDWLGGQQGSAIHLSTSQLWDDYKHVLTHPASYLVLGDTQVPVFVIQETTFLRGLWYLMPGLWLLSKGFVLNCEISDSKIARNIPLLLLQKSAAAVPVSFLILVSPFHWSSNFIHHLSKTYLLFPW